MLCRSAIGKDQLLPLNVDVVNIFPVDNQTPANSDKVYARLFQLPLYHLLYITQLAHHDPVLAVALHDGGIVAIGGNIHNVATCKTQKVVIGRYDKKFLHRDVKIKHDA